MSRYRFALRPLWVLSHLLVLALVVAMVTAGLWQLDRLHEKQDRNARVMARTAEPVVDVSSITDAGRYDEAASIEFRRVEATGTYRADQEVLVRSRSNGGSPGSWVLTPLDLGDGAAVVVNRGWIPNSGGLHEVPEAAAAPSGEVTVVGLVRRSETRGSFGPRDPAEGTLTDLARADIARLDQQVPEDLLPVYVQLEEQQPGLPATAPRPVPAPALDEGPHLSYAVQWFIFTTIALVGYPLILRRNARPDKSRDRSVEPDVEPPPTPTKDVEAKL